MNLGEYLKAAGRQRREAGEHDCCTFPSNWAMECGHPDPMAQWRGTYDTDEQAEQIVAQARDVGEATGRGGLDLLFSEGMGGAGLRELAPGEPFEAGDVGVVSLMGVEAGAIYAGTRWAYVPERGLGFATLEAECIARAWRPRHG